ncbi:hypothetical protein GCM10009127_25080 [Alteraurantiacibacter aestuarii]|uniref:outer membrane beta-barrel protein n=1 Tax=Alteraurantiacibacter aestuarii TaxID=650004 RepID=UPI0031D95950
MRRFRTTLLLAAAIFPHTAFAQNAEEPSASAFAGDQAATAQDTPPASSGRTTIDASLDLGAVYSDNIFATRQREVDDLLLVARPRLNIAHRDGADSIAVRAQGEFGRYDQNDSENYDDWLIGIDGRLGLSGAATLLAGGDLRREHEGRSSPEATNGISPTEYDRLYSYLGMLINSDPIFVRVAGTMTDYNYDDVATLGGIINNDDRDRTMVDLGLRVGHELPSGMQIFVQGAFDYREYDTAADDFGYQRNSEGFSIGAGVRHQLSRRLSAEAHVGYLQQRYDDPRLPNISTVDFGAVIDWSGPAGLSASLRTDRTVEETTLPGASAYVLTTSSFALRALPHPRLNTGLTIWGSHYDYRGAPRSEFVTGANVWTRYYLNSHLYLGLDYNLAQRSSNAAGFDYDENRFMISIGGQVQPRYSSAVSPLRLGGAAPGGAYAAVLLGHGTLATAIDGPRLIGSNTADFGGTGESYGAAIGYGVTTGIVYFGLEGEAMLGGPDWVHASDRMFAVEKKDSFGIAARLGLVTGESDLLYVRLGMNAASLRTRYDFAPDSYRDSDRKTGLGFGLGMDASAGERGFVRFEYVMSSYGDYDVPAGGGNIDNFSSSESQFRLGGGVRFGGASVDTKDIAQVDFSGPYVGVQIGHGALTSDNAGIRLGSTAIDVPRSSHGPLLGLMAGFGEVFGRTYLGLEVAGDVSNIDWNVDRDQAGLIYSAEHDYSFGASARVGQLLGKTSMIFAQGGVVRTRFDLPFNTATASVRSTRTQTGLRLGIGVETGLGANTRLRLDYSATQYRRYDVQYDLQADSFDHAETQFRIGLLWHL